MNRYALTRRATGALALGAALLVAPLGFAQNDEEEEVFTLSPFTVEGSDNQGYRATSTLAGTRIRTDLKDVGSAISVVTEEFLRDTNATDNESLLIYTVGTEVGGLAGNFAGGGDGGRVDTDSQRLRPNQATRVRGLAAADNTRDFFQTDIPWDSYNVSRIDLQRGPNSVLFGLGSPAGVINATTNGATFENAGSAQVRFDSNDSLRFSVDYNKVLIEDQLSVRVSALNEDQKYMQNGAFEEDERYYVAFKWQPKIFGSDSSSTIIKGSFEDGNIKANRPRVIPPIDRITPWFTDMGKETFDVTTVDATALTRGSGSYSPWVGAAVGRLFDGPVAVYENESSANQAYYFMAGGDLIDDTYRGILSYENYAQNYNEGEGLRGASIGAWKSKTLTDPTIFDFYNNLIDGPNKSEWQKWRASNFSLSHNMLDNKLGFELVVDKQNYEDGQTNVLDNAGQAITVDIMSTLPDGTATGRPNPNVGRPFVGGDAQNNGVNFRDRENFRFTGYYDVDFRDSGSDSLANILGRHVFTGVYSKSKYTQKSANWIRATSSNINADANDPGIPGNKNDPITQADRYITNVVYIGPSLSGASSASGANMSALQAELLPTNGTTNVVSGTIPVNVWSEPAGDINNLYRAGTYANNITDSKAFVWQGFLFDGLVVPTFGYRTDADAAGNAGNIGNVDGINGARNPNSDTWILPRDTTQTDDANNKTYATASGISRTFSLVVHSPQAMRDAMGGTGLSLTYSKSENFRPDASRRDLVGNPISASSGETEEMGIVISSKDNRFNFKINKYETKVFKDTLSSSSIGNSYMIGAGEGWGYEAAVMASNGAGRFTDNYALVDETLPESVDNPRIDPAIGELRYQPQDGESIADALAHQNAVLDAVLDPANNVGTDIMNQFISFWNQDWTSDGQGGIGSGWNGEPTAFAITGDTISEGYEYELFYQPTDNWNIAFNASKTEAKRLNIAESYASWVDARWELYQSAYGDSRIWGGSNSAETIRGKFGAEFYSNYTLFNLLNNSNVAELRPWRFNVVTNYSFSDGKLGGLSVGGALRWQDDVVVGYPVLGSGTNEDPYAFDVSSPYKGGAETNMDLWASYEMPINDNIDWRIQLNIKNAFEDDGLIGVTSQPDGTAATSRIKEGQSWTLTNTFSF